MATLGSNFISGITTSNFNPTDVANKNYVDNYTFTGGKFLTTTDGTSTSLDFISNYQEFITPGISTFTVPSYSNLLFIEAVGAGGGGSSPTREGLGVTWILRTSGANNTISTLTFGNNLYLAGGNSGTLTTSTDTISWTLRTSGFSTNAISTLTFANGLYVAGGASGVLNTSTDAISWTLRTSGFATNAVGALTFGNNLYVAGGGNGRISTSTDAITWSLRTSGVGINSIVSLISTDNYYIAGAVSGRLVTSTDSIIWTLRTCGFGLNAINALTFGNNLYVAGGPFGILNTSTNGIQWTLRTSGFGSSNVNALTFGNGFYVASGSNSTLMTSTDAITWSLRSSGFSSISNISYLIAANNLCIASSDSGFSISYLELPGQGGASGSYTSWYIPKQIVLSNITVNIGAGGIGSTVIDTKGSAGQNTSLSWTGPGGTYALTASGGSATLVGASQTTITSYFYTTSGLLGASTSTNNASNATPQTNKFQPTGGGSGAGPMMSVGGDGGSINVYGITTSASGGNLTGTNGENAVVISGLPYGYGGGGGGTSDLIAGNGGNGVRGGGGGGGAASIGSSFGYGGNGGDGYVKISWW